jgi:hypothetical protein
MHFKEECSYLGAGEPLSYQAVITPIYTQNIRPSKIADTVNLSQLNVLSDQIVS